jgi:mono/diheme cytochrome c family protein
MNGTPFAWLSRSAVAAAVVCCASLVLDGRAAPAAGPSLAQGDYLVHHVGMCIDCHGADLMGGPNPPGPPGVPWAKTVPSIVGLPMFKSEAEASAFLQTAKLPDGSSALGPMPHYTMHADDADSVVAYLRSLKK